MALNYRVTREASLSAAHLLRNYNGECGQLHGHNWTVQVTVSAQKLDDLGMVIDFKLLNKHIKAVIDSLDHKFINDLTPFDKINPTSENLAAYFYQQLGRLINDDRVKVSQVKVWETEKSFATVEE